MMGEREGWGDDRDNHSVDEFAGIGTHVHEIGHLLGFSRPTFHPDGVWVGTNPYTGQTTGDVAGMPSNTVTVRFAAANLSGWGSMQSGAHGPDKVGDGGYTAEFRSCPNPYNPFFRRDLGWNTHQDITTTTLNQRIEPGPGHYYVVPGANGQDYLLDFRTAEGFGRYTGWFQFESSPGLLLWRRTSSRRASNALLIPADGRSIVDARQRPGQAEPTAEDVTYTYVWQDRLSDPFGAVEQDGPFGPLPGSPHRPTITQATDATHLRHVTDTNPDPGDSHLAFRNIRNNGDHALVDIYTNYWSGEITGSVTWSGTVYVGGDVTIGPDLELTIEPGTEVRFLPHTDDTAGGRDVGKAELIVEGTLTARGTDANGITFRSAELEVPSNADWYGIRVDSAASAALTHATIRDAARGVRAHKPQTLVVKNDTFRHCGVFALGAYSSASDSLAGNTLFDSGWGVYLYGSRATLRHHLIRNNAYHGIRTENSTLSVINTTIDSNASSGVFAISGTTTLSSSSLTRNGGAGVTVSDEPALPFPLPGTPAPAVVAVSYSNVHANRVGAYRGLSDATGSHGNLSSVAGYSDSFTVAGHAQLVDAGAPGATEEPAGTWPARVNIGRWGDTPSATASSAGAALVNGDFESTLRYWGAVKDTAWARVDRAHSNKQGSWYASTCDTLVGADGDCGSHHASNAARGILRSSKFQLSGSPLRFKIAGYDGPECDQEVNAVRLYRARDDSLLLTQPPPCAAAFEEVSWAVGAELLNEWVYIDLIDGDSADSVAWIAADDFRLPAVAAKAMAAKSRPLSFALEPNYPNPFNPHTMVRYALPEAQQVRLEIYDLLGQKVRTLVDGAQPPGSYRLVWDGRNDRGLAVASGVYFYRLKTPQFRHTRKMLLLR